MSLMNYKMRVYTVIVYFIALGVGYGLAVLIRG